MASSRFLDFMERSYLQDAFYGPFNNGFSPGVTLFDYNEAETVTWALGGYKNTQNVFAYDTGDNEYALTGRMTCVPWSACEDRRAACTWASARRTAGWIRTRRPRRATCGIRSRASLRNGPGPLNPDAGRHELRRPAVRGERNAARARGGAGRWARGSPQAEYVSGFVNSTTFTPIARRAGRTWARCTSRAATSQVLYFLTGEHRAYDRHEGRFGRVVAESATPSVCPTAAG